MSWTEHPIHFLDFEGSRASGVLEYGVAVLQRGAIIETHTRVCRAIGRVSDADAAVHGLREAEVASAAPFADEWDRFADLRERGPFAAHYAGVENALLKAAWPYPRASADFARPGETVIEWGPWIDTAALYRQLYPAVGTGRLEALVVAAGVQGQLDALAAQHCPPTRRRYHAALYDALAGALLLAVLGRDPAVAALSLPQLLALSVLDPERRDDLLQRELF